LLEEFQMNIINFLAYYSANGYSNGLEVGNILFDPYCDPNSPVVVTCANVEKAMTQIKHGVVRTPCTVS